MMARVCLALLAALLLAPRGAGGEIIDRILAVVGDRIITLSDVRAALQFRLVPADVSTDPVDAALQRLIDRRLVLAEVERYAQPDPAAAAVDAALADVRARFTEEEAWDAALARSALSAEGLRGFLRDSLRIEAYLAQRFASIVQLSEDELRQFHAQHAGEFPAPASAGTLEGIRDAVRTRAVEAQRERLVAEWVDGLRRRASIVVLYLPDRAS